MRVSPDNPVVIHTRETGFQRSPAKRPWAKPVMILPTLVSDGTSKTHTNAHADSHINCCVSTSHIYGTGS